jgi:hypothetical protein
MATMLTAFYGQAGAQVGFEAGVSKFHTPTWGTNRVDGTPYSGRVWDIAVHEPSHTAYIVGEFTAIAPTLELAGAIDAASGLPQPGFPKIESGEVKVAVPDGAGGWYIGGNFKITLSATDSRVALARIRADGTVDPQWKPQLAQQSAAPSTVWALAVHNSYVYVGGDFTRFQGGFARNHLARLSAATGTVDVGWDPSPDGTVVRCIAVSPDGAMVYVAGDFSTIRGQSRPGVAALRSQGAALESWAPAVTGVGALAVSPDSARVYLGGDSLVAADLAGNLLWSNAGKVKTVAVSRDGSTVFAGGAFTSLGGQPRSHLAAVDTATGAIDASWRPEIDGSDVAALTVSEDGSTVYTGGDFISVRGHARNRLAAVNAATGTVEAWDPNVKDGTVVALSASGSQVYAGGTFTNLGARPVTMAAAIDTDTGQMVEAWKPDIQNLKPDGSPEVDPPLVQAVAMSTDGNTIYLGGNFTHVNGSPHKHLVAVDRATGTAVENFKPGDFQGTIRGLAVNGNKLYVGGDFKEVRISGSVHGVGRPDNPCPAGQSDCIPICPSSKPTCTASESKSSRWIRHGLIAALDAATGFVDPDFDKTPESSGCGLIGQGGADCGSGFGAVKSIVIDPVRGFLYAGGTFSDLGGQLGLFAANLADGSFTAWQPDMDYPAFDLDLFKGDNFHSLFVAAGGAGGHVIRYLPHDGPATPTWDRRFDGDATAVDSSERAVYVGGHYDFIDGGAYRRKHAAALNLDGEVAVNWDPEIDTNTGVFAVKVVPGQMVIYGGEFSRVNRRPQPGYAQFPALPGERP